MTREPLPFDHRPDPALGAALRQALEPPEGSHAAFVARLLARVDDSRGAGSWGRVLEIGRASCRGRGEISGGAVSLKKKKKIREPISSLYKNKSYAKFLNGLPICINTLNMMMEIILQ